MMHASAVPPADEQFMRSSACDEVFVSTTTHHDGGAVTGRAQNDSGPRAIPHSEPRRPFTHPVHTAHSLYPSLIPLLH